MSYSIIYIVDLPGRLFNQLLPAESRLPTEDIEVYAETGAEHEVTLSHTEEVVGVELSGCVTRICLSYKYSWYVLDAKTKDAVERWERHLRQIVPDVKIARLGEHLMDSWEQIASTSARDGFWYRRPELVAEFFQWLETQDREQWGFVAV
jgi:hypothetical protein